MSLKYNDAFYFPTDNRLYHIIKKKKNKISLMLQNWLFISLYIYLKIFIIQIIKYSYLFI